MSSNSIVQDSGVNICGFDYLKDESGIVNVVMNLDGPVNAMNAQYRMAMSETVSRLENETDLKGVVFSSAKKTFFAGGDIKEMLSVQKGQEDEQFQQIMGIKGNLRRIEQLKVPVVAAINGAALGGGLEICLACNYRVLLNSPKAIIGLPEVTLGLLPGAGGIVRTIHMMGLQKALPYLLEGKRLKPEAAHQAGFVDELVDDEKELVSTAKRWILNHAEQWQQPWDKKGHKIPGGDIWNPKNIEVLSVTPAMLFKKTAGLLPAPEKILAVAADTLAAGFDAALKVEARALAYLITTAEAKNIITSTFIQMNAINSGSSRPEGEAPSLVKKVGVLGAGMMGQGIAYACAVAGIDVVLKDISQEAADKGKAYTDKVLSKKVAKGRMTDDQKAATLALINPTDRDVDLEGCDLIIEAVFEDIELKSKVIKSSEPLLAEGGVFASNTSTLPIGQLSESTSNPDNFIGIHFFSPVDKMPLIELICGAQTSEKTLARAFDFARQIKKTPIVVNDSLGFFTSRVFGTYMDEGARLLTEGVNPVVIDALGQQIGMPVGPLAVQDEVSQELTKKAAQTQKHMGVFGSLSDTSVGSDLCERMITEFGRGGRHHGGGYYEYSSDGSKQIWPKLYDLYYDSALQVDNQDIKDRLLFRQVIESLKCLEENVLRSVADGNVGSMLGIGAPAWTGGFIQFINTYGLEQFSERCHELADRYGERFEVPAIVEKKLNTNELFL